ncbi:MAG: hypothetical protein RMJ88_16830, partial [Thermogemmata sp.]|nr:hypothetical protein [Thermogemmata sp.]
MAAVHVTLEEAAARLGISPDEFKRRLKTDPNFKILVPIRDGATLRFKASMVDELARQLGGASDPGLYLAPIPEKADKDSDELRLTTLLVEGTQTPSTTPPSTTHDEADIFSFAPEPSSSSKGEARPISEVRLGASSRKLSSTSGNIHKSDVSPGEEINLDLGSSHSAVIRGASSSKLVPSPSTSKISGSGVGSAASSPRSQQQADDSSEFQLSLEPEGDDLQLSLNEESDEVKVGEELTVNPTHGASGINLHKPTDSGISLEKDSPAPLLTTEKSSGDELDFELTLDSHTAASGVKLSGLINKPSMVSDSDSEFELTLDDSSSDAASMEHAALEELQE